MHEPINGVRVTNAEIYQLLRAVEKKVDSVEQSVTETIKPQLKDQGDRIDSLEFRVFAILAGLSAAVITALGAKGAGLI